MKLTSDEAATGLDEQRLEDLRIAFEVAGFVALENAVPLGLVDEVRRAVHAQRELDQTYLTFQTLTGEETDIGCTFFPWVAPFDRAEIVAHPVLLQLLSKVMGDPFVCRIYCTNLAKPGSVSQPVHVDVGTVLEDGTLRTHRNISAHVVLRDFTSENGSTELWPGTHHYRCRKSDAELLNRLAPEIPSVRANYPAGTMFVRETAVWHRGVANRTDIWREMLSMNFVPAGTPYADVTFGRALEIQPAQLAALPPAAVPVWAPNVVSPYPADQLGAS